MINIKSLVWDEWAQDVIEYTLLLCFLALAAAGLFLGSGGQVQAIWSTADSQLALADGGSGSTSTTSSTAPSSGSGQGDSGGNQGGNQGGNPGGNGGHDHHGGHGGGGWGGGWGGHGHWWF